MATDTDPSTEQKRALDGVKRMIVKVGSAVIAADGHLHPGVITRLADEVVAVRERDIEVVLVVSGAVAGGYGALGKTRSPQGVVERQAAACVGQHKLMSAFAEAFATRDVEVAQLLMAAEDIANRRRFLSARHALNMLLHKNVVPIVNENDPLADDEDKIGDNDTLAALVTNVASAQWLVILSTVDGVRRDGGGGDIIADVEVGSSIDEHISTSMSASGVGGMAAKVKAARLASHWGVPTVIANGTMPGTLERLVDGEPLGTYFAPRRSRLSLRKRWIAFRAKSSGTIQADAGAKRAIIQDKAALLPTGVTGVEGRFSMGARVELADETGCVFAVGLTSYAAHEIRQMQGRKPTEFKAILGYEYVPEIIDREDLVCLTESEKVGK